MEEEGWLTASGALRFAGDVRNGGLRQAAIAAGDGVRAAFAVASYLAGAYKTIWKY